MIFTTFRDFSEFFLIFNDFIFYLNRSKINKNKKNTFCARDPRGCDVARKATWQRHADPRSAYVARIYYSII